MRLDVSPERGQNCYVITTKPMHRRAAEIHMGPGQPVAEPQVADTGWPKAQDLADDIKDKAVCRIELEQRQHCFAVLHQGDDRTIASHSVHDASRIVRFYA